MASAQASDNSSNVSNDVIAEFAREYRTQKRACEEAQGVLRSILKRAKSAGVDTKALTAAVAATKLEPDEVLANKRNEVRYLNLLRIDVSADDLFAGWDGRVTDKTRAEDDLWDVQTSGYKAGREGQKIDDCPHQPGSEFDVAWREFWHKGQASIARELGPDGKVASTSRARPSRARQQRMEGTERRQTAPEDGSDAPAPERRGRGRPRKQPAGNVETIQAPETIN